MRDGNGDKTINVEFHTKLGIPEIIVSIEGKDYIFSKLELASAIKSMTV